MLQKPGENCPLGCIGLRLSPLGSADALEYMKLIIEICKKSTVCVEAGKHTNCLQLVLLQTLNLQKGIEKGIHNLRNKANIRIRNDLWFDPWMCGLLSPPDRGALDGKQPLVAPHRRALRPHTPIYRGEEVVQNTTPATENMEHRREGELGPLRARTPFR